MNAPQITLIALYFITLLLNAHSHGKPRKGNDNFWHNLLGIAIHVFILIWGGFFNN